MFSDSALLGHDKESWDADTCPGVGDFVSYDDDYVFQVGPPEEDIWVSTYQIIYFFAALCFVFDGLLDVIRTRHVIHILMMLAGIFGVVSAIYVEEDIRLSNIFECVSVHLFLGEAFAFFGEHKRMALSVDHPKWIQKSVLLADAEFTLGALLDVIVRRLYFLTSFLA